MTAVCITGARPVLYTGGGPRPLEMDWPAQAPTSERDRLTGYALDEHGAYRVPVVVDGVVHVPRFHPCGDAECLAVGANIDFSDPATLNWIRTVDANTADKTAKALAVGAVVASGGGSSVFAGLSSVAGLVSGYLDEDFTGAITAVGLGMGFESYAVSRGLPKDVAGKVSNLLGAVGVWDSVVSNARGRFEGE